MAIWVSGLSGAQSQTAEVPEACASALDRTQAATGRRLCLRAAFLNVRIISNCVKSPLPKGLSMAARALMLTRQIVFGFETQSVFLHLASPADTGLRRSC